MRLTVLLAILLTVPAICFAQTTWYVPNDFTTIQGAINGSSNGDTVIVRPGTYVENINFLGKAISVTSEKGADVTIIDGNQSGSVVTFDSGENFDSILNGFIITNGKIYYGGGICCENNAAPFLTNNIITGNIADDNGGGIYCYLSSPTVISNKITNNTGTNGGGIYCEYSSSKIINNTISENTVILGGGGIFLYYSDSSIVFHNIIMYNSGGADGGGIDCINSSNSINDNLIACNVIGVGGVGGGIACYNCSPDIINNAIINNNCDYYSMGGGIYCVGSSSEISSNTIVDNSAFYGGGGIVSGSYSNLRITNTVIWNNTSLDGPEIWIGNSTYPASVTISYSDVRGAVSSCYVDTNCTLNWGPGMIDSDPLFVDHANNDFHLKYPSPCRDTGDNSAVTELYDFEGDPRIAYGKVDMGADEFYPHLYYTGNATPSGNIDLKFIGIPGKTINGLILGVNIFDPPLPCDYGLWFMDNPFQIMYGFGAIPADGVKIFPGTIGASPPAPYTVYLQAAIDSWLTNLCTVNVQ